MTLRDHRNKAKERDFGRAQLSPAGSKAHFGKRRTRLTSQRVKAATKDHQPLETDDEKGANDESDA